MSLAQTLLEDRRAVILASLAEVPGFRLNENTLHRGLGSIGHQVTHDQLRGDLNWLMAAGLIRVTPEGDLWIAVLTASGQDVANGAAYPGVATPRAS